MASHDASDDCDDSENEESGNSTNHFHGDSWTKEKDSIIIQQCTVENNQPCSQTNVTKVLGPMHGRVPAVHRPE